MPRRISFLALAIILLIVSMLLTESSTEFIAHRGASYDAPENTLASINLAWQRNADAVEIDVLLSKDGKIVVFHDESTKELAGVDRPVNQQTLAELKKLDVGRWKGKKFAGERIPTLAEVIETIPSGKRLFIEVKTGPEIVPELTSVLENSKKLPKQIAIIGFSLTTMTAVKQALPEYKVFLVAKQEQSFFSRKWKPSTATLIQQAETAKLDGLDLNASKAVNTKTVEQIHKAGLKIFVWTVNSPRAAQQLIKAGVDGITTDRPKWLKQQLEEL